MVHRAMSGSAVCKMKPSACSPVSLSAFGPYAAIQILELAVAHPRMRSGWPWWSPRALGQPLITVIASDSVGQRHGRLADDPAGRGRRGDPQTVRLPYMS